MNTSLEFKIFQKKHFEEYNNWFKNKRIKKALGFIDDEWLEFILNDANGIEYAIFQGNNMVSVVGLIFPTNEYHSYAIKNIAVNPEYFGKGIGTSVLKMLYKLHPLKTNEFWLTFVDKMNLSGQLFFKKNGWIKIKGNELEDNMLRYELRF